MAQLVRALVSYIYMIRLLTVWPSKGREFEPHRGQITSSFFDIFLSFSFFDLLGELSKTPRPTQQLLHPVLHSTPGYVGIYVNVLIFGCCELVSVSIVFIKSFLFIDLK